MGKVNTFLRLVKDDRKKIPQILSNNFAKTKLSHLVPDKAYLKLRYRTSMGKKLNLSNPVTFNEKLQWLKLYDRKPEYTMMVDKYAVKEYVAKIIGEEYIIPTLGVWDSFDEIDFDSLPNQFVLKCTHDSGSIVICRNKAGFDRGKAKKRLQKGLNTEMFFWGREWPYKDVKPRIIAEKYMEDETQQHGLRDYKIYCFHGEPEFLYISEGLEDHSTAKISFVNLDWTLAPFARSDYTPFELLPAKPKNYNEMLFAAKMLAKNIPFVRVDLYEVQNRMYFSELTFSPCSGMMPFVPAEWDEIVGNMLVLPNKI